VEVATQHEMVQRAHHVRRKPSSDQKATSLDLLPRGAWLEVICNRLLIKRYSSVTAAFSVAWQALVY
jgi:hypothetical protein